MKAPRPYAKITITPKGEAALTGGHPWVYEGEVTAADGGPEDGALVDVVSRRGSWLGCGFYNSRSKIRVRLVSRNANDDFSDAFWERRIRYAWEYRKVVMGETDSRCCRVIFGEADLFPGLTVDRFESVLVTQTLSLGMERIKDRLFPLLVKVLREDGQDIRGIYERNDVAIRGLEGMEQNKGWYPLPGETPPERTDVDIVENGITYTVDFENGQKTGFFLDQKYNRLAVARLAKGRTVLDCFTHTGSFALNAGIAGAKSVLGVDASQLAVDQATENAKLNGLENTVSFRCADVFELLPELEAQGEKYDVVILDPPAFTKSRNSIKNAVKGYREINLRGLKLVKDGGFLVTCSCSHFMDPELFAKTIREASHGAHKRLRQVEFKTQGPDHPILWAADESYYLKFYIFQVVDER